MVETCYRPGSSLSSATVPPVVRYRHRQQDKYICFSRGKVRVLVSNNMDMELGSRPYWAPQQAGCRPGNNLLPLGRLPNLLCVLPSSDTRERWPNR